MTMGHTRFEATIKLKGHHSPMGGFITRENCAILANNGTTPHPSHLPKLAAQIDRIMIELSRGITVETSTAVVTPKA